MFFADVEARDRWIAEHIGSPEARAAGLSETEPVWPDDADVSAARACLWYADGRFNKAAQAASVAMSDPQNVNRLALLVTRALLVGVSPADMAYALSQIVDRPGVTR